MDPKSKRGYNFIAFYTGVSIRFRLQYCFMFFIFSYNCPAQLIVNVENARIHSDTIGWAGNINTSFAFTQNTQQVLNINAGTHIQYKTKKDLYLFLANYNLLKGNNHQFTNNTFYHLRYNRKVGKILQWEAFTQMQQNSINNIALRALFGTGPRFKLYAVKKFRLYAATLIMYEHEKDKDPSVTYNDLRSDNYVSFTYKPTAIIDITSTTFYQPLYRRLADFRLLNQISVNVKATKHLAITLNWDYSYDAFPAVGTPLINYTITNGFNYTF